MTIVGSLRSPFVRICRMYMIQNNIVCDFKVLNFVDDPKDALELSKITPINKVPLLIDGDKKIFDSRVIMNYLTQKYALPSRSLEEENLVSVIYSCLDTSVTLFLMRKDGFDINAKGFFLERQRARIPDNINFITPWAEKLDSQEPKDWNYASMSLFSYLYWAQARDLLKISDHPVMENFMKKFANAKGVAETVF